MSVAAEKANHLALATRVNPDQLKRTRSRHWSRFSHRSFQEILINCKHWNHRARTFTPVTNTPK